MISLFPKARVLAMIVNKNTKWLLLGHGIVLDETDMSGKSRVVQRWVMYTRNASNLPPAVEVRVVDPAAGGSVPADLAGYGAVTTKAEFVAKVRQYWNQQPTGFDFFSASHRYVLAIETSEESSGPPEISPARMPSFPNPQSVGSAQADTGTRLLVDPAREEVLGFLASVTHDTDKIAEHWLLYPNYRAPVVSGAELLLTDATTYGRANDLIALGIWREGSTLVRVACTNRDYTSFPAGDVGV